MARAARVVLGLGSNIDAEQHISMAVSAVSQDFSQALFSKVYRSIAVGFEGGDFLNMVASFQSELSVEDLLKWTDSLEQRAGRVRQQRGHFDSRTLDVDILMYGTLTGSHFGRQWPDDDLTRYAHVLLPMSELHGEMNHPVLGRSFARLWREFDQTDVEIEATDLIL